MPESPSDFPFTFRCQRSGNCCALPEGSVFVTPAEVTRIAAHLNMEEAAFRKRFVAPRGDRLRKGLGPECVFLQPGRIGSGAIYEERPAQCRSWPFWDELRDPDALRDAMRFCPGIELSESDPPTISTEP